MSSICLAFTQHARAKVGFSQVGGVQHAVEWSGGAVIDLGGLPGSTQSRALGINDSGQVVGTSDSVATEWSGGAVIDLGALAGALTSEANAINGSGQIVGFITVPQPSIPEPSTWAMMLLGFAGLGLAGYRRARIAVSARERRV
jgi:probable HAF family extracellular repeat protein